MARERQVVPGDNGVGRPEFILPFANTLIENNSPLLRDPELRQTIANAVQMVEQSGQQIPPYVNTIVEFLRENPPAAAAAQALHGTPEQRAPAVQGGAELLREPQEPLGQAGAADVGAPQIVPPPQFAAQARADAGAAAAAPPPARGRGRSATPRGVRWAEDGFEAPPEPIPARARSASRHRINPDVAARTALPAALQALPPEDARNMVQEQLARQNYESAQTHLPTDEENHALAAERAARELQQTDARRAAAAAAQAHVAARPEFNVGVATGVQHPGVPSGAQIESTYMGQPHWMTGPSGLLQQHLRRVMHNLSKPHTSYHGQRIADLAENEKEAAHQIRAMVDSPETRNLSRQALARVGEAGRTSAYDDFVRPYLEEGTAGLEADDVYRHLDPFEEKIIRQYEDKSDRRFYGTQLPQLERKFIGMGGYRSGAAQKAIREAIQDHNDKVAEHVTGLMSHGYKHAQEMAERGKTRQLQGAGEAGKVGTADLERRLESGRIGQGLISTANADRRLDLDALQQLGTKHRAHHQLGLSQQHEDWISEQRHPIEMDREMSNQINRMPPTETMTFGAKPIQPGAVSASPFTVAGLGMGQLVGQSLLGHRKNDAKGGRVSKFDGGGISDIPERLELIEKLKSRAGELENSKRSPFWSWFTNLMSNTAGNLNNAPNKDVWSAAGAALPAAAKGWTDAEDYNEETQDKAQSLRSAIAQSQALQQERMANYDQKKKEWELKELVAKSQIRANDAKASRYSAMGSGKSQFKQMNPATYNKILDEKKKRLASTEAEKVAAEGILRTSGELGGDLRGLGSWLSRKASDPTSPFYNSARMAYDKDKLTDLDLFNKHVGDLRVAKKVNIKGVTHVGVENDIRKSLGSADINQAANLKLATKNTSTANPQYAEQFVDTSIYEATGDPKLSSKMARAITKKYGTSNEAIEKYPAIVDEYLNTGVLPEIPELQAVKEAPMTPQEKAAAELKARGKL